MPFIVDMFQQVCWSMRVDCVLIVGASVQSGKSGYSLLYCINRGTHQTREESNLQNSLCFKPLGQKDNNASSNGQLVLEIQVSFLQQSTDAAQIAGPKDSEIERLYQHDQINDIKSLKL